MRRLDEATLASAITINSYPNELTNNTQMIPNHIVHHLLNRSIRTSPTIPALQTSFAEGNAKR